jgi:transposase
MPDTAGNVGQLAQFAEEWRDMQARADDARKRLAANAKQAHAVGMSAYRIAQITGAAPDTVAKWLRATNN